MWNPLCLTQSDNIHLRLEPDHSEKSYQSEGYLVTKGIDLIIFFSYKPTAPKNTDKKS